MKLKTPVLGKAILLFVLIYFVIAGTNLFAQNESNGRSNSLETGKWALQFQINNNFTLSSFQGAILSAKYHLADDHAIRIGIGGSYSSSDLNSAMKNQPNDTTSGGRNSIEDSKNLGFSLNVQYLNYISSEKEFTLFCGYGPIIKYTNLDSDRLIETYNNFNISTWAKDHVITEGHNWGFGVSGLLGAEWFASKSFSIHAEYGIELLYNWAELNSTDTITDSYNPDQIRKTYSSGTQKNWVVNASSIKFGLSVYF